MRKIYKILLPALFCIAPLTASAQSFRVQCPTSTITHPDPTNTGVNNAEPFYNGPTQFNPPTAGAPSGTSGGFYTPKAGTVNGAIRCQQISGGDGFMTEADGTQTFMFSFGPLSGLADVAAGHPSSQFPNVFNTPYNFPLNVGGAGPSAVLVPGDPATTDQAMSGANPWPGFPGPFSPAFTWNGAVGLAPDIATNVTVSDLVEGPVTAALYPGATAPGCPTTSASATTVTAWTDAPSGLVAGGQVVIGNVVAEGPTPTPPGYAGTWKVTCVATGPAMNPGVAGAQFTEYAFQFTDTGITSVTVATPGNGYAVGDAISLTGGGGTGAVATVATISGAGATGPIATVTLTIGGSGYASAPTVDTTLTGTGSGATLTATVASTTLLAADTGLDLAATASSPAIIDGHVDPRQIMDVGVMNGNIPAPLAAFDEDDEFFLTLTNVGMIMRPDLFEQHTVHFHGYPNASSFYDGVPDASIAINIGASFTYYYLAPDAGTYFWHCHITPPEHLQMGMVGQLHVRPRQDRVPPGKSLYTYLGYQNGIGLPAGTVADLRTVCNPGRDILCSATMPAVNTGAVEGTDLLGNPQRYTYNDGDGSTAYDVEYPIQMHGFDPNFHFVGMTFNPEMFVDMKDKYFLLNGRGYPDTVAPGPQATITTDGQRHYSQPLPAIINIPAGGKALLRLVNLSVTEYHTLESVGIPMKEVGFMAKLLRDQAGINTEFYTNSITLGGGESLDVILDASDAGCIAYAGAGCAATLYKPGSVFYVYTPQLDHLSNDAENFGGMMTEVHICTSVTGGNTFGNTCN